MTILARSAREHGHAVFDNEMMIRRRDIHTAAIVLRILFGMLDRKRPASIENLRQHTLRPNVHGDKDRGIEVLWQMFEQLDESIEAAGRRADNDSVAFWHGLALLNGIVP